jgi:uncharacterized membrane-anchored protein
VATEYLETGEIMTVTASRPPKVGGSAKYVLRKLPLVTALFWALKIVAVTLGETGSDEFAIQLKFGYVACAVAFFAFFVIIVGVQLRAKRFYPGIFWTVIFSTSIVGTAISDLMDRGVGHSGTVTRNGIGYGAGAVILTSLLVIIFLVWWRTGQTYDVEKIATRKGEVLYWAAILVSNTLGTASGDWLSHGAGLGFRNAFFAIAGVMLLLLAARYLTSINTMVLFWLAFILTRPLSAAAGDSITKPASEGGLGLGTLWGSVVLVGVLAALVAYQTWHIRRHPLDMLPAPTHRITGQPQQPNGLVVRACGPHPDQIVEVSKEASRCSDGAGSEPCDGEADDETRAGAVALDVDDAAVDGDDVADDGQSQSAAAGVSGARVVQACEAVENTLSVGPGDAGPVVRDDKLRGAVADAKAHVDP